MLFKLHILENVPVGSRSVNDPSLSSKISAFAEKTARVLENRRRVDISIHLNNDNSPKISSVSNSFIPS